MFASTVAILGIVVLSIIIVIFFSSMILANGDFYVLINNPENPELEKTKKMILPFKNRLPGYMNHHFNLPYNVYLIFEECGVDKRPHYIPPNKIKICYEFIESSQKLIGNVTENSALTPFQKGELLTGIMFFSIFHEIGHTLIDAYDLQVNVKLEDAVDFFSLLILVNILEEFNRETYGLSGPMVFFDEESKKKNTVFSDKYSSDEERRDWILCLSYGKFGPDVFPPNLISALIDQERLDEECESDFLEVSAYWQQNLKPFLKTDSDFLSRIN